MQAHLDRHGHKRGQGQLGGDRRRGGRRRHAPPRPRMPSRAQSAPLCGHGAGNDHGGQPLPQRPHVAVAVEAAAVATAAAASVTVAEAPKGARPPARPSQHHNGDHPAARATRRRPPTPRRASRPTAGATVTTRRGRTTAGTVCRCRVVAAAAFDALPAGARREAGKHVGEGGGHVRVGKARPVCNGRRNDILYLDGGRCWGACRCHGCRGWGTVG